MIFSLFFAYYLELKFVYVFVSQDMFLVGIDTGALTMIWEMTKLTKKPTVMKKAQYEIRCSGEERKANRK